MANTLMSLLVSIGVDTSELETGLGKAEKQSIMSAGSIGSGLSTIGGAAVGAIGAAAVGAGAFVASTVAPASDLNETMSKVSVVFGENSDAVLAFGDNSANALGMSKNSALSAAATYGNLFQAMGIGADDTANMSTELVTLAGDLASFNNMNPTDVLDALRSGLSGETEPLKRLGVNINQAMIEQKALSDGIWDGVSPITAAQKAQATYALVMEQTTLAQGDFARTSDGVANQQRIMSANFEDMKAKIGTALLPMLMELSKTLLKLFADPKFQAGLAAFITGISNFSSFVITNIPVVLAAFDNLGKWFADNEGVIVGILSALGVAILAFAGTAAVAAWTALAPFLPVIAIMALVGLAAYALYEMWTNNMWGIQEKVKVAWDAIVAAFTVVKDTVISIWNTFMSIFKPLVAAFQAAMSGDWYSFGENLRLAWDAVWLAIGNAINAAWSVITGAASRIIKSVIDFFTKPAGKSWGDVGLDIIKGIANGIAGGVKWIVDAAKAAAKAAGDAVKGFFGGGEGTSTTASPKKAFGGSVLANRAYTVGEHGQETFVPATNGKIIPNGQGGGGSQTINVTVLNPVKETSEESVRKTLKNLSYIGAMG